MATIPLSLLLRAEARTGEGLAKAQQAAASLGLLPSASGRATLSCRVSNSKFVELFGILPPTLPARPPQRSEAGTPAGYAALDLPVPSVLAEWVESLSVQPPATRHT